MATERSAESNRNDYAVDGPRDNLGRLVPKDVTAEDKLIEYYTKTPPPHTCRKAADYVGMSYAWCSIRWASIRDRQEKVNAASVEEWRIAQLHDVARAKEECYAVLDDKEVSNEDRVAASKCLMACIDREMKLTGTAKPVQLQILPGPALEEYMKTLPAEMIARAQAGDVKAIAEIKAGMQTWKAGG